MDSHNIKRNENLIYVAVWATILVVYVLHLMSENSSMGKELFTFGDAVHVISALGPLLCLFLLNNIVLIPQLLMKHKVWLYTLAVALATILVTCWLYGDGMGYHPQLHNNPPMHGRPYMDLPPEAFHGRGPRPKESLVSMPFIHDFIFAALVVGMNLAVALVSRQIISNIEHERLVSANVAGQLEHLKTQINPHFYMNMLNNIHGLVDLNPEKAKDMIMDMSRLMQYMLYDSAKELISLSAEISFLNDYLRIMRRRFSRAKVNICVDFPDESSVINVKVPPLLFLVFIENAFKHGVDYRHESFVAVSMKVSSGRLHFECMNSVHPAKPQNIKPGGIGLENIKKRISLIFGNDASLTINQSSENYLVSLQIPVYETPNTDN